MGNDMQRFIFVVIQRSSLLVQDIRSREKECLVLWIFHKENNDNMQVSIKWAGKKQTSQRSQNSRSRDIGELVLKGSSYRESGQIEYQQLWKMCCIMWCQCVSVVIQIWKKQLFIFQSKLDKVE